MSNTAAIGPKALMPNPALEPFQRLIGTWRTSGSHPYLPGAKLAGRTSFEWAYGGAFLQVRSEVDHPEIPDGIALIGSDDNAGTFYMLYFDERGISRKYDVTVTDSGYSWHRNDPHLSQRMTLDVVGDKLVSRGEMSRDGGEWEGDLSMEYEREGHGGSTDGS